MKNALILGLSAVAIYLLWKNFAPINNTPIPEPPAPKNPCPDNFTACENGSGCYDPKINYLINPCGKKLEQVTIAIGNG